VSPCSIPVSVAATVLGIETGGEGTVATEEAPAGGGAIEGPGSGVNKPATGKAASNGENARQSEQRAIGAMRSTPPKHDVENARQSQNCGGSDRPLSSDCEYRAIALSAIDLTRVLT
jgi:hypothetical protein